MIYIYTRVSTAKQTTDNQSHDLLFKFPGAELIEEVATSKRARPKLDQLIATLKKGDTVVVYSLDRLGRSVKDVLGIIERLMALEVEVVFIREGVSYTSAAGKLLIQIMAAVAEMERNLISERTKTALQARKAKGMKLGRPRVLPGHKRAKAMAMLASGKSIRIVAKLLNVSKSTVQEWQVAASVELSGP